jgi:hypothetical protein
MRVAIRMKSIAEYAGRRGCSTAAGLIEVADG